MRRQTLVENLMSNRVTLLKVSLLAILVLSFASCSFKKDDAKTDSEVKLDGQVIEHEFSVTVEPQESLFSYKANLKWSMPDFCRPIIQRQDIKFLTTEVIEARDVVGEYVDLQIADGRKYIYSISCQSGMTVQLLKTVNIDVPKDLALHDKTDANQLQGIPYDEKTKTYSAKLGRLYLFADLKLKLKDKTLKLSARQIVSEPGAEIATFSENDRADFGVEGLDGGLVILEAEEGVGKLQLNFRGQAGGHGKEPKAVDEDEFTGSKGDDGADTVYAYRHFNVMRDCSPACIPTISCVTPAQNGGRGGKGKPGENGGNGRNGGKSGYLFLRIKKSALQAHVSSELSDNGKGFKMPEDAKGRRGGQGGDPGKRISIRDFYDSIPGHALIKPHFDRVQLNKCVETPEAQGSEGPRGDAGLSGVKGEMGDAQKSYIYNPVTQQMDEI